MSLPSEPHRYQKHVGGAQLGHPIKVTKSKKHSPGGIFTLGTDYKTREWATFHIDDIDAVPLPIIQSIDSSISKRPVPGELPKYKDIVIPVDVSVKDCPEDKLPFGTIPIKIVSPEKEEKHIVNDNQKNKKEVSRAETRPPSSSQSVGSQSQSISSESQSSKNIFGIRNPMESYSFRGTKLSKKRFEGGRLSCTQVAMNDDDNDIFSLHSYESKASQQESSATLNDLLNYSSNDISDVNADWPAHQIHSRMMGWKLTSPERRQGLLRMLATADLSTASMTEEEQRLYRKSAVAKKQKKNQVLAKRQTEAYENTVSRFAQHQNKEFKFSKNQRDNMKAKVSKMGDGGSGVDRVVRPCGRKLDKEIFQYDRSDPFASIEVHRAFTAEAVVGLRQRQAQRAEAQCKVTHKRGDERVDQKDESVQQPYTGRSQQLEPVSARHRLQEVTRPPFFRVDSATQGNINSTPGFQAVGRNHRDLLNRADRMELLSNARDVERAATISGQVAQMVDDYVVGSPNNFIGAGSPKRGLTGEAYLMSIQSVGNQRKPVPMQTADWER